MKSIIIQIRGERTEQTINLIALHGFNITSDTETTILTTLYKLYGNSSFMLNDAVKAQIKAKLSYPTPSNYTQLRGITDGNIKTNISRLIKSGAIVKDGKLLGLNVAFKDAKDVGQIVLRIE